jgi:hypothetical protein
VISIKQDWRAKEKIDTPAPMTSDDDMDLLDDDEAPFFKGRSPPLIGWTSTWYSRCRLSSGALRRRSLRYCLDPKEAMFEKPEESSQHLRPLYIWGHIDGKPISMMLIDSGTAVNLMSYSVFKKLGMEGGEPVKTNLMLNGVGGNLMEARGVISMELTVGSKSLATTTFIVTVHGNYSVILGRNWIHANRCIPSTLHQFLI